MRKKPEILIIEDDEETRRELGEYLSRAGYDTAFIGQFSDVAKKALKEAPDLILLDVNLPGINGLHICEQIRQTSQIPIIFVTGNNTSMDELNCMLRGGDDYVAKPYQLPVLMARIAAVLRRTMREEETEDSRREYKGVSLDLAAAQIRKEDRKQELTKNEVKILHCLFQHTGEIVAREDILDYLWEHDVFIDDNTLSVHITRIRNKLKEEDTWQEDLLEASGTDEIVVMISDVFVRDIDAAEMKFVITSVTFPLEYIALIFVCVAVTILAVQQLSDSSKYKFRYEVLRKLGMKRKETDRLIFRQLGMYYLVPAAVAAVIVVYAGDQFVRYTGAEGNGFFYFGASLLVALSVYLLYFLATYMGFKRNVNE